ncbi:gluconeogenesis factor YvcK family protein [Acidipropionibacterium timonense]|uniref:gluconeogenesis factor YvcK family protein n=1 Tax=Acidipropionibacterium timonense TaxID=2161818 RepID=UPI0010307658|nr:uridine diphosphate-N-acetylglucosamine-binding protein YvcK [Acidipropionibacterium timonense]
MYRPAVTAFGGGHGLAVSLRALRRITDRITAVVTVADNGGSSGRLREEFDCLPPGDLRRALAALCADDFVGRTWAQVLQARFRGSGVLAGHAIGNLLIAGLWQELGDPVAGLDMVGQLLGTRGRVLPMALTPLDIAAEVVGLDPLQPDETYTLTGQSTVAKTRAEVIKVRLDPPDPPACPTVLEAIAASDVVVLGPGSWFTSVMPHLLVPQIVEAIMDSHATKILTLNVAGADETDGFSPARHLEVIAEHEPRIRFDVVLADRSFAGSDSHLESFAHNLGARIVEADLAMRDGSARHDPLRLASAYADIMGVRIR